MTEEIQTTVPAKPKRNIKKTLVVSLVTLIVLSAGIIAGLLLVKQPQDIREKASVATGTAKLYITPETKTISGGETFTTTILFDTAGIAISGLTVKLEYPFTGSEPPISITNVEINPSLILDDNWDFPYKNFSEAGGTGKVEIAGLSASTSGYTTGGQENLATVTFKGNGAGTINVAFNATESVMASKTEGKDILLIPQSSGTYIVSGGSATATPTGSATASPTSSSLATVSPSPTTSGTASATPIPTAPPVPETGVGNSTLITAATGLLLIIGAVVLAL